MKEVPKGWMSAALGDLVELHYGKGLPEKARRHGHVSVYGSNGIVGSHDVPATAGPTIIVGRKGSVGEIHFSPDPCWPIDTTYFVDTFGPYKPTFLCHLLRWLNLAQHESSTAIPGLSRDDAYASDALVPPLAEQGRIAAKVDELFAQVNEARDHLTRVQAIMDRFRQSVLAAACSGSLTEEWRVSNHSRPIRDVLEVRRSRLATSKTRMRRMSSAVGPNANALPRIPDSWAWAWLSELGELNRGKSRHRPRNDPRLLGGPYPFVQTGDIARSGGRVTSHDHTYSQAGLEQSRLWPAGTVCITIAANIAESAILTYAACFPDSVVGLIASSDVCVGEYAEYFVRTARRDLARYAPATAQANINLEILREVAVPLPPVEEQREIARRVNDLLEKADAVERGAVTNDARAERLRQSILAKAFRGELVPTEAEIAAREGRPFESATDLLERIRVRDSAVRR